ncbi:heme exporter protein CcmB [Bacillaceae bacterium]
MRFFKQTLLIVQRDLRIEFRRKSLLLSMGIFSLLIQVVLHISFDARKEAMQAIAPGILWLPILLAAMLGFSRYGAAERENGALTGILISPIDRGALFLGKLLGNLVVVLLVAAVSVPSFFLFLKQPFPQSPGLLVTTLFLGSWGFVAVGIFLATLALSSSITELLVPIMLFPLSVPLIIGIVRLTEIALYPTLASDQLLWVSVLIGYDLIFTIIPMLLFDLLLEL